ncbi:hypothetical protein [Allonocardiopsis opalescens]|uniref:hypothetical protein n=1 Tax=Allonocardiopsis opalescens TaxID=1144618 RepID=UPI001B80BAC9|nr:hypothetical protein [Allonocardiopsis opalescens]
MEFAAAHRPPGAEYVFRLGDDLGRGLPAWGQLLDRERVRTCWLEVRPPRHHTDVALPNSFALTIWCAVARGGLSFSVRYHRAEDDPQVPWVALIDGARQHQLARRPLVDLDEARTELSDALTAADDLALYAGQPHPWRRYFAWARKTLRAGTEASGLPALPGYSEEASRLYAAVVRGWVLGGANSWSQAGPLNEPDFTAVTARLLRAYLKALTAAVNSAADRLG